MGVKQLWHRQRGETDRAWEGFLAYRALPLKERTTRQAAEQAKLPAKSCQNWGSRNNWRARAEAHDDWLAKKADQAEGQAVTKAAEANAAEWARRRTALIEEEWQMGAKLMKRAAQMLDTLETERGNFRDLAKIIELASKLQRMSQGMATEILDVADESERPVVLSANLMARAHAMLGEYYGRHHKGIHGGGPKAGGKQ